MVLGVQRPADLVDRDRTTGELGHHALVVREYLCPSTGQLGELRSLLLDVEDGHEQTLAGDEHGPSIGGVAGDLGVRLVQESRAVRILDRGDVGNLVPLRRREGDLDDVDVVEPGVGGPVDLVGLDHITGGATS